MYKIFVTFAVKWLKALQIITKNRIKNQFKRSFTKTSQFSDTLNI